MATKNTQNILSKLFSEFGVVEAVQKDLDALSTAAPQNIEALIKNREIQQPSERFNEFRKIGAQTRATIALKSADQRENYKVHAEKAQQAINARSKSLEAYAIRKRVVTQPASGAWVVAGQITDKSSGKGLPNLVVRAYDMDRKLDDYLGTTKTDALGYYRIEYTEQDFKDSGEGENPETFIVVLGKNNEVLFTSPKSFIEKSGPAMKIDAEIDGTKVPESLAISNNVNDFVDKKMKRFVNKQAVLEGRKIVATKPIAGLVKVRTPARTLPSKLTRIEPTGETESPKETVPVKKKTVKKKKLTIRKKKKKSQSSVKKHLEDD